MHKSVSESARLFSFRALSKRRVVASLVGAAIACLCITMNLATPLHHGFEGELSSLIRDFCAGFASPDESPQLLLMTAGIALLFMFGMKREPIRTHWPVVLLSLFFGFAMVFGWVLDQGYDIGMLLKGKAQALKAVLAMGAWGCVAYAAMTLLFKTIDKGIDGADTFRLTRGEPSSTPNVNTSRFIRAFDNHTFGLSFVLLLIFWLPVIIGTAPGLFMGDTYTQICMWYGLPHDRSAASVLVDPSVTWTTHHPVLHTALVGLCVQIGQSVFGDVNCGLMVYVLAQVLVDVSVISYSLHALQRLGVSTPLRITVLVFLCLVPWFPTYGVLVTKDTLFADALLMLCMQFALAWKETHGAKDEALSRRRIVLIAVSALLVALLRNGAILFALCGCIAFAFACLPKGAFARKQALACLGVVIVAVTVFNSAVVPALHIAPGSKVEMLSIPFQQTARYVVEHPNDVSDDERQAVDRILGFKGLAERYDPLRADNVKDYAAPICRDATPAEWKSYFDAWVSMGLRHPGCYMEATLHNYYGYFYVSKMNNQLYRVKRSDKIMGLTNEATGFDFHRFTEGPVAKATDFDEAYSFVFRRVPIISLALNSAAWCWLLLLVTAYAIRRRWRYAIPALAMLWLVMLVFLAGPCNGANYNRYVYPIAFILPFMLALFPAWHDRHGRAGHARAIK